MQLVRTFLPFVYATSYKFRRFSDLSAPGKGHPARAVWPLQLRSTDSSCPPACLLACLHVCTALITHRHTELCLLPLCPCPVFWSQLLLQLMLPMLSGSVKAHRRLRWPKISESINRLAALVVNLLSQWNNFSR